MKLEIEDDMISLEDFLGEAPAEAEKESFTVDTTEKADWCLTRAGEAQWLIGKYEGERDRLIARINAVCTEKTKDAYDTVEKMAGHLDGWAHKESEAIKKKTIPMIGGSLKIVTGRESLVITDEGALLKWLNKEHPELLTVKETVSIDKNGVKKLLSGGMSAPGCSVERGRDRLQMNPTITKGIEE